MIWILFLFFSGINQVYAHQIDLPCSHFHEGFIHPFSGLDHMLAMFAVGLWASQQRKQWILPLSFLCCMIFGGALGFKQLFFPSVEMGIALSVILLGSLIAWRKDLGHVLPCMIAGFFALFHGYAHGTELIGVSKIAPCVFGFTLATLLLHIAGITLGKSIEKSRWEGAIQRASGIAISSIGLILFIDLI